MTVIVAVQIGMVDLVIYVTEIPVRFNATELKKLADNKNIDGMNKCGIARRKDEIANEPKK